MRSIQIKTLNLIVYNIYESLITYLKDQKDTIKYNQEYGYNLSKTKTPYS